MFPDAQDVPSKPPQFLRRFSVSLLVFLNLLRPEAIIRFGLNTMFWTAKIMSGEPGRSRRCNLKRKPRACSAERNFLSGRVLRPRMRLMLSRRCAGVSTSAISSCSGHLVSAASKGASGHNDASIRNSLSNNFPRRFKRGRVACGRRDSDDDFRAVRAADFDLGRARLLCPAGRPRNIGLRDCGRAAAHDCVSWAFMAKPSINSTLTIKFSVRHAIERFHYPRDQ
jgi:hypothetical protein